MNSVELRAAISLAGVFAARLLGLFMVYPVFAHDAGQLRGATPVMIGLALGGYGIAQGLLQIPFGLLSDRIGRKTVISIGLALFGIGSVVAALATSIEGVLVGRLLQGAGAIGSSILALVGDLTRDEVRTRAMAIVGVTIGVSFGIAIVVGPLVAAAGGLSGIFWLTAVLALIGLPITWWAAPNPAPGLRRQATSRASFRRVLSSPDLLRLDFAIFSLHAILTASFLVIPGVLARAFHLSGATQWQLYLPLLVVAMVLMVPAIIVAETRGRIKEVFLAAIAVLGACLVALAFGGGAALSAAIALGAFMTAFNVTEAILPSLVTKLAPPEAKGAATGVYSSSQFIGIFAGGAGGGWLLAGAGQGGVFLAGAALCLAWLVVAATMRRPPQPAGRRHAHSAQLEPS